MCHSPSGCWTGGRSLRLGLACRQASPEAPLAARKQPMRGAGGVLPRAILKLTPAAETRQQTQRSRRPVISVCFSVHLCQLLVFLLTSPARDLNLHTV